MLNRLATLIQYPLPHHLLGRCMYAFMRIRQPWIKHRQIQWAIRHYKIDLREAELPFPDAYPDFNSFFTRALHPQARPVCEGANDIASPADGVISQLGAIREGQLIQAKHRHYTLDALLGGYTHISAIFNDGHFATIYLSPRDYHRVHMPLDGRLQDMIYLPGRLFSVNHTTTRLIPNLFARNERLITTFATPRGVVAVILVGAIFVSGIETVWSGDFGQTMRRPFQRWNYAKDAGLPEVVLKKGEEMGRFNMGSTVILLLPKGALTWADGLTAGSPVKMGQRLAHR